jgi:acetyltransferase-like isoleucine patch superfamily enzyme
MIAASAIVNTAAYFPHFRYADRMRNRSHGTGAFVPADLGSCGPDCVFEADVLVFHPERVFLGSNVYVGHRTLLKAYHLNELRVGDETWIGQNCFLHSAGGITIGARVGIGPGVMILTSEHRELGRAVPPLLSPVDLAPVAIEDEVNLGVGSIVLPGVCIGRGARIGAGSVVTHNIAAYCIAAGSPARVLRERPA